VEMDNRDSEFLKRIQATFRIEAEEHLKSFSSGLIELEKTPTKEALTGIIETMFREIHSLKGAARSIGQKEIESICQPLESLFSALKRQEVILNQATFDLFSKSAEVLSKLVSAGGSEQSHVERQPYKDLLQQLKQFDAVSGNVGVKEEQSNLNIIKAGESSPNLKSTSGSLTNPSMGTRQTFAEVVRIPNSKLDPLLLQAEEFIQTKMSINQLADDLNTVHEEVLEWKAESVKWRERRAIASKAQWNEWYDRNELRLNNLENFFATVTRSMERDGYNFERMVNDHLEAMKQVLMLPVSVLVEAFPAMVREISRDKQKEIEFFIQGAELEIDKRILEELKDPLIHFIRNSIDHGIESPRERMLLNKPPRGKITLAFTAKESGLAEITVTDDGKGIDKEKVLKAALKAGVISNEAIEKLAPDEIISLIFQSGVSTSPIITDLSGRGIGLSIVREKVEKLNGKCSIETEKSIGTTFRVLLPMTLATFRGILIRLGDSLFVLPTMNVERVIRVKPEDITTIENHETIKIDETILSVVGLAEVLGLPDRKNNNSRSTQLETEHSDRIRIVILVSGDTRIAFKVEEVLDEQQVLVKGLGKLLNRVKNISGATILGSGKVVPVLNVADLMKSAVWVRGMAKEISGEREAMIKSGKILVAEDSITARTLLKSILETAGYEVTTAVDGANAFTLAKSEKFDLVVSDVDMPRMNGFELTKKIREDKKLSEIPVILITALETREDMERGMEAGADAYIIKSSFDQGNLLEIIKKLI
jgi:two-component system, chemotaxis family, sensor kinase CheA